MTTDDRCPTPRFLSPCPSSSCTSTCYCTSQKNTNGLRAGAKYTSFRVGINTLAKMYP